MGGKIFVLRDGGELTELSRTSYQSEDDLQALIAKHPSILAGDQINPDNPREWILVSREMGVPDKQDGSDRWALDHLFIDQDAIPTFIEVKRSADTRLRREVVAQMLDYAANAIEYWPVSKLRELHEKQEAEGNSKSLSDLDVKPDGEDSFWKQVSTNLRTGKIRLIFAADVIPQELQTVIEFLNRQMIDTEVLGLELKQFLSADGLTTLVPLIVGKTAISTQTKREYRKWDEESFLGQVASVSNDEAVSICKRLIASFEELGCSFWWGEGKIHGSFIAVYEQKQRHLLCSVYNWDKATRIQIQFGYMKPPFDTMDYRVKLREYIERIPGVRIPDDRLHKYPSFPVNTLADDNSYNLFVDAMRMYIDDIKKNEAS